jgi:hypothetical protein
MSYFLVKKIEDKNIVWFNKSNSYLVFAPIVTEILAKIDTKNSLSDIETWCSKKIEAPKKVLLDLITSIYKIYNENNFTPIKNEKIETSYQVPTLFFSEKYYTINNYIFKIQYQKAYHKSKIHPPFAHLEIDRPSNFHFNYTIFDKEKHITFLKDNHFIDQWSQMDAHYFEGKLSMQLLIDIYNKPEADWMGVFHASAISNGKESMLFLGDSGSGKSTSLALLNANGLDCIADDFVPIDNNKNIHSYPAAISIKKESIKALFPYYPELEKSAEYSLKKRNKVIKYLAPKVINYNQKLKCKALIFIKYNSEIELDIHPISKIEAFEQLVPDSWISPIEENVNLFLDWFLQLPCYQLTYSNNTKMIETVSKLFNDEL